MTRLIDADALCRHLSDWQYGSMTDGNHDVEYGVIENVIEGIEKEPTIDAVPVRHGKWKCTYSPNGFLLEQTCSECGLTFEEPSGVDYNYCPNCGADMRGEEEWTK